MSDQYFKGLLNSRGLKATGHRLKLLVSMEAYTSAMPYSTIQESMKSIDRVTLYRTLETLINQGIIHQALRENNEVYYAICGKKCSENNHHHDHIHFKCTGCNSVTCHELSNNIKISIPDCEIHNVSIHVKGICKSCRI
ncbi:MAG: Fur family ferric uptake transcriptional regulator [Polaribacter sp.]|jgi:Fur family ferric uptake transcriptional regulator